MSGAAALKCIRCKSTDLTLSEVAHEHGSFTDLVLNEDNQIEALGEGVFSAGDIQLHLTRIHCHGCGHDWHPRRRFAGCRFPA